ncbi:MAG: Trk family potassium uptake protein, partial [Lachnospiraceae bacterium]|nr:Trk family potassium uptake protein [Lachnospiraceae bacterium]
SSETVRTAATVLLMYHVLFLAAGIVISRIESLPLLTCLFETSSAIATVGLTLGITPGLSLVSRGILVALMFMGRVGGMTLLLSAFADKKVSSGRLPEENVNVG